MGYTKKLSEVLAIGEHIEYTTKTGAAVTGAAIDMKGHHRAIMYVLGGATVGTLAAKFQASSATTFGSATTITSTTTGSASCTKTLCIDGEQIQDKRGEPDRYIRAVVTSTGASKFTTLVLKDCARAKPA